MTVQFLAFLQDSYREAKSGWLLHIMLVLSVLLILLVLSIGFRPVTVNDELDYKLSLFSRVVATNPESGRPHFEIDNVTTSNPAEPWKADYAFDFVVTTDSPEDMKKASQSGLPVVRSEVEKFLRADLKYLNNVEVTGGPPELQTAPDKLDAPGKKDGDAKDKASEAKKEPVLPKEVRYKVTTKGTKVEDRLAWRHKVSILFAYEIPFIFISLREGVYYLEKYLVNWGGGWLLLFISVVATAGFIPNMLTKGSLDLMVSKPIGRARLLVYKYIGGLTFAFVLTTVTAVGVWIAIGLRSGLWSVNFLTVIPVLTFCFAVLYAFSTFAAVLTRHTLVAILLTVLAWGLLWGIGKVNDGIETRREEAAKMKPVGGAGDVMQQIEADKPLWNFIPTSSFPVFTGLHFLTPRTYEMDDRLVRVIASGVLTPTEMKAKEYDTAPRTSWAEMILVSLVGIGALLGVSCLLFSSRDY
jgi:ABC-type transport system involved in multi-copper enzyme maturation permease subunit